MGALHNKDTFRDWLQFVGYTPKEIESIGTRIGAQKGTKEDYLLFWEYLETKAPDPHLYDL